MSFKVFASADALEPIVVTDRNSFGDPRIIQRYPRDGVCVTNEEYFTFARSLFTEENIRNNPSIFAAGGRSANIINGFVEKFLQKVPADLYQYAFGYSYSYNTWDTRHTDQRYVPTYDSYGAHVYGTNYGGSGVEPNNDNYWASVILYLSTVKDFFAGSVWNAVKSHRVNASTMAADNIFRPAAHLMNGYRYIYRATNLQQIGSASLVNAGEVAEILREPNNEISLTYLDAAGWVLLCPVSVRNKSSLYQVFPANTDVTAILGKGTPAKKTIVKQGKTIEVKKCTPKMYGVELELTTDKTAKDMITLQGDPVGFLVKQDSSISGSKRHKYECVTMPMEMVDHRKLWTRFFANVGSKNDFDVSTQTNNGMHVHIARSLFTDDHLKQFTWFITAPEHREFILLLSQRTQDSFDRWSPAPKYTNYQTHLKAFKNCVSAVGSLRGAVNTGNTRNKPTVEVRIFKGIVSCAEVLRNLEVVDAIFEFTRPGFSSYRSLTIRNFYDWVKSTPKNQYKYLRADLWKLDIPLLVKKARVLRILFNVTDPEIMVKKINEEVIKTEKEKGEAKLEVDKIVYATVTRVIGRRCLSIGTDGKLAVSQKAVGRIAHLDDKIIKGYDKQTKAAK